MSIENHATLQSEIEKHPTFHRDLSKRDADRKLKEATSRECHLTRRSRRRNAYVLSVVNKNKMINTPVHFKLEIRGENEAKTYNLEGYESQSKKCCSQLLHYYKDTRVNWKIRRGIGNGKHVIASHPESF